MESEKTYTCPMCSGDGINRCTNPDHGFIQAMPGDVGRLGCPCCGHDPLHRVKGEKCEVCNGTGIANEKDALQFCSDYEIDSDELIPAEVNQRLTN